MKKSLMGLFFTAIAVLTVQSCGGGGGGSGVQYNVGGTVTGLVGTLVLQNNDTPLPNITEDGEYSTMADEGTSYNITILTQPEKVRCRVQNGTGPVTADIDNINVSCSMMAGVFTIDYQPDMNAPESVQLTQNSAGIKSSAAAAVFSNFSMELTYDGELNCSGGFFNFPSDEDERAISDCEIDDDLETQTITFKVTDEEDALHTATLTRKDTAQGDGLLSGNFTISSPDCEEISGTMRLTDNDSGTVTGELEAVNTRLTVNYTGAYNEVCYANIIDTGVDPQVFKQCGDCTIPDSDSDTQLTIVCNINGADCTVNFSR